MTQSARNKPVHVSVEARERESSERLVRRFIKKCKKLKIHDIFLNKCPDSAYFIKPSDIRRMKKRKMTHRSKKKQEELNSETN